MHACSLSVVTCSQHGERKLCGPQATAMPLQTRQVLHESRSRRSTQMPAHHRQPGSACGPRLHLRTADQEPHRVTGVRSELSMQVATGCGTWCR